MKIKLSLLLSFLYFFTYAQDSVLKPNLVVNGKISGFSAEEAGKATNAINGIDNKDNDLWSTLVGFPQFIEIDLGADKNIQASKVTSFLNRIYKYKIEARSSDGTYKTVIDRTHNGSPLKVDFWPKKIMARFVKLTITGTLNPSVTATSIREFSIYGE
ncbi:discoidin domain-containing protein [Pedobacter glucosidilyticus]|uniref:discoidin domain-containing protein n=1 Tax=Pedobacter glucosidilyticus TaxID=1122941 RepID=UPI0026EE39EC|nr:discoidin domain-containing protein [Pedobacter glucosidilyticus]